MAIRIFIADDHPIVWDGLRQIVSEQGDMRVVGAVASGDALLAALQQQELPDVVVCDMSMPGRSGIELIKALRTGWPGLPVLALGVDDAGMHALPAIRWVAGGRLYIGEDVAGKLAHAASGGTLLPHTVLSKREQQVFTMLVEGLAVSAIAERLYLSVKTVSTHKTNILRKLGVTNIAR